VHGLGGDAIDSWRANGDDEALWPRWLAPDISGLAIFSIGDPAAVSDWQGTAMPLQDRAGDIVEILLVELEALPRSIIFVCHSTLWGAGPPGSPASFLYPFDILELNGCDLRRTPMGNPPGALERVLTKEQDGIPAFRAPGRRRPRHVPGRMSHGPRGHRFEAARSALPVGAFAGPDQGEESGRAATRILEP